MGPDDRTEPADRGRPPEKGLPRGADSNSRISAYLKIALHPACFDRACLKSFSRALKVRAVALRRSSLVLGTKKEDLTQGQFAYFGDIEGGLAGEPLRLSWGHRRRTCWRASRLSWWGQKRRACWRDSSLTLGTKTEALPESQFDCPRDMCVQTAATTFFCGVSTS